MTKLPKYKITIDPSYSDGEDLGIEMIAFTSTPAIKVKGMAFSSDQIKKKFFVDDVKMRVAAPALIPMEIYRNDEDGEYYVEFTEDEIQALACKFMANLTNKNKFNLEHNSEEIVPAYILEAWIVEDPKRDKAYSSYGIEVPKGTMMLVSQITDKNYYNQLVANGQVGYSIEGFLGMKLSELINKNKQNEMKTKLSAGVLPEGTEFEIDGIKYTVKNGEVIVVEKPVEEVKAAVTEEKKDDTVDTVEKPVEEMKAAEDVVPVETPKEVAKTLDEAAVLAIIQPKLDEIYQMIAALKAEEVTEEDVTPEKTAPVQMSIHDKFATVMKFVKD